MRPELNRAIQVRSGMVSHITPEEYASKTADLFREWKGAVDTQGTPFITDGVMDPEKWFQQAERPLFLLKEAYGGDRDWDLVKDHVLSNGKIRPMWKQLSLWSKALLRGSIRLPGFYDPDEEELNHFGNRYLHDIAAVNLKKYCGVNPSNSEDLLRYTRKDRDFLRKQIALCDPTVIICCYTGSALQELFDFGKGRHNEPSLYYHFELNNHEVLVLDYYHPSNHFPEIMNYYTLRAIYDQAKSDRFIRIKNQFEEV